MKNVILIGFMGTGKTSIGKMLATKLGCAFIDMDVLIEEQSGMSIPAMFEKYGEAYFRNKESELAVTLSERQNAVISTGGGIVKNPANIEALRKSGPIVCLTADVDTILVRTSRRGERPVLDNADDGNRRLAIEKLLSERSAMYQQCDFSIDTSELSPLQVVEAIIRYLRSRGALHA